MAAVLAAATGEHAEGFADHNKIMHFILVQIMTKQMIGKTWPSALLMSCPACSICCNAESVMNAAREWEDGRGTGPRASAYVLYCHQPWRYLLLLGATS